MADRYWQKKLNSYQNESWANLPSIFSETAITYFPDNGEVLELGAGTGQDTVFFARKGYRVTSTDIETKLLTQTVANLPEKIRDRVNVTELDLRDSLPFNDHSFDVIYAHLSIHYFDTKTTTILFGEIFRVLRPEGMLAILVNSTKDPEYKTGKKIEDDYSDVDGVLKHFFSVESIKRFTRQLSPVLLDNSGDTYKDRDKGTYNLIRYIGKRLDPN